MRIHSGTITFSATDLVNFLGCKHASFLDRRNLDDPVPIGEDDPYVILLQEKGIEHERRYLESLRRDGRQVIEIASDGSLAERVARTRDAMAAGAEVIYQGALLSSGWQGYADFLVRAPVESRLGSFSYEPLDTKLSRSAKPKHVLQLCVYARLLATEQGLIPSRIHIVLGDGSLIALPLSDFHYYFEIARQCLEDFVAHLPGTSVGQPCSHCGLCRWRERCEAEWDATDHLSLVANITRGQTVKLNDAGITTMTALASLARGARIASLQPETLTRLQGQARLQVAKRADGENRCELLGAVPGKGFARLPRPSAGDLFFDMEGDPLFEGGGSSISSDSLIPRLGNHDLLLFGVMTVPVKGRRSSEPWISSWPVWQRTLTHTFITMPNTRRVHSSGSLCSTVHGKTTLIISCGRESSSICTG